MDTIKNAYKSATEKVQQTFASSSKEANTEAAKDSDLSATTRAKAAGDAVADQVDETSHAAKSEGYKQAATH